MYPFPGNLLVARPEYHWRKGRFIHRRRFAELQENFVVDIKMLSASQRAERYEPFNIRRERRVSSSHFVRSAEYRRRNDFPRLGRNTLERNVLCRAVRGNVFQPHAGVLLRRFPGSPRYLAIRGRRQIQNGVRRISCRMKFGQAVLMVSS